MLSKLSSSLVDAIIAGTTAAGADLDFIGADTRGVAVSVGVAEPAGTAGAAADQGTWVARGVPEGRVATSDDPAVAPEADVPVVGTLAIIDLDRPAGKRRAFLLSWKVPSRTHHRMRQFSADILPDRPAYSS
jgi:hypothetical protein